MTTHSTDYSPGGAASVTDATTDGSVKERASEAVDQGREAAGQVTQTAAEHAQEVKHEAAQQARDLMGEARSQVTRQVGDQRQNLVNSLRSLSEELGSMVQSSQQRGTATEFASQARERVAGVADWLDGREPAAILDELRSFARRRPGAFLLGALAAGALAGRLTRGAVAAHTEGSGNQSEAPGSHNGQSTLPAGYSTGGAYGQPAGGQPPAPGPGYAQPDTGYAAPGSGYAGPDTGYATPGSGYTEPGTGYGTPGSGYTEPGTGYGTTTQFGKTTSYGEPREGGATR